MIQSSSDKIMIFLSFSGKREKSIGCSKCFEVRKPPKGIPNCAALNCFLFLIPPTAVITSWRVIPSSISTTPGFSTRPAIITFFPVSTVCVSRLNCSEMENTDPKALCNKIFFFAVIRSSIHDSCFYNIRSILSKIHEYIYLHILDSFYVLPFGKERIILNSKVQLLPI